MTKLSDLYNAKSTSRNNAIGHSDAYGDELDSLGGKLSAEIVEAVQAWFEEQDKGDRKSILNHVLEALTIATIEVEGTAVLIQIRRFEDE